MLTPIEERWYAALRKGAPDWSVYSEDLYTAEAWGCWAIYTRKSLMAMQVPRLRDFLQELSHHRSVVDLGCGIGFSTAAIAEMLPQATVVATNLDGTVQTRIAKEIGRERGFSVFNDVASIGKYVDLVFACEYFEHFESPLEHLREVVSKLSPKAMLVANSFGTRAIGHFETYKIAGKRFSGSDTSRAFNSLMRHFGFEKVKTKLWNNKPTYWKRTFPRSKRRR